MAIMESILKIIKFTFPLILLMTFNLDLYAETDQAELIKRLTSNITRPEDFKFFRKNSLQIINLIISNPDPKVRASAAFNAGELNFEGAIENLTKALLDDDPSVVKSAAEALSHFDETASASNHILAIQRMPLSNETELQFLLQFIPRKVKNNEIIKMKAIEIIRPLSTQENREIQFTAIITLGHLNDPQISDILFNYSVDVNFPDKSEEFRFYQQMFLDQARKNYNNTK